MRARNASRDFERQMNALSHSIRRIFHSSMCVCTPAFKALNPHASKRVGKYHAHISRSFLRWIFLPKNENQSSQPYSRRAFGRFVFRFSLWIYSQSRPRNGNLNANILSKGKKKVYYYRGFVGKLFGYWFRMNVSFFFSLSSAVEWYVIVA